MRFAPLARRNHRPQHQTTRRRRGRPPRLLAGLLTAALAAGLAVAVPTAAQAAGNSLQLPGGGEYVTLGANAALYIDGTITYDDHCEADGEGGVDDFVYPATDVYLVPAGSVSEGSELHDAAGDNPNTIIGTGGGAFLGELIAVTYPTGKLGDGEYDIVYDTCQDGKFSDSDEIFYDAVVVDVPDGQIPPVDPSLKAVKDKARQEYADWLKMHIGLTAILKIGDAQSLAACLLAPETGCLMEILEGIYGPEDPLAQANGRITSQALALVANQAAHYGAIWQDPADPQFDQLPVVETKNVPDLVAPGRPIPDAFVRMQPSMLQQEALTVALLHAMERYQGAQAKGDAEWALVQARAVRDLSAALDQYLGADTAVADLRAAFAAEADRVTGALDKGAAFRERVRTSGFTPDERRALLNRGVSAADITGLEDAWVADGPARTMTKDQLLGMFDAVLADNTAMRQALAQSVVGWDSVVGTLEHEAGDVHPTAEAGGPYSAPHGDVTLDATGSHVSPAAALIRTYAWDLDGDGQFDDATGATPTVHVDSSRTVSLQITDDNGRQAVDFAQVTVTDGDRAPAVSAASPAAATTVVTGTSTPLSVTASDPDGDPLSYAWSVDGHDVGGDAASFTYNPSDADVGAHLVQVTVRGRSAATVHQWTISVLAPDTDKDGWTATPDCDDSRADVHPGAYERLGNGRDDDCDPASPDGPTGGITGSVSGWGSSIGVGLTPRPNQSLPYPTPVQVTSLGSTVRQVESTYAMGLAVLSDGTVRTWGEPFSGRLGDGTSTERWTPTGVLNVGGAAGTLLGGVASVSADSDTVLALRANGTVVAWGNNGLGQVGDGSTVASRPAPVTVLTDQQQPLSGVAQVEEGENSSYAVMADGTVRTWGVDRCDGGTDSTKAVKRNVATTNARFGAGVVQIASGDGGGALVRKADGSLWSCAGYDTTLGRPHTIYDVNDLRPVTGLGSGVVDVTMGGDAAAALKEDGSVWLWGKNLNHTLDVLGLGASYSQETPAKVTLPPGAPVLDVEADYSDTFFALRADGSVVVWGADTYGSSGTGSSGFVNGFATLDLGGARAIGVANSTWNGLALTRPADDAALEMPAQYVSASVADTEVTEGTSGSATLTLSQPAPFDLTVTYTVGDGPEQTAPVTKGATTAQLPVQVADDALDQPNRTLPLQVAGISHAVRVTGGAAVVTVHDDDAAPAVSVGDVQVAEGNTSLTDVAVPVTLSAPSGQDVQVAWSTQDGTATAPGDYAEAHGVAIIPAGETATTLHLSVVGDSAVEPDEQLTVQLSDPVNASVGTGTGTVTVTDDEPLRADVSDVSVTEGDSGTSPAVFTVSVPAIPAGETLTVPWSVMGGTAEVGPDVQAAQGEVTLTADRPSAQVSVQVVGDTVAEQPEQEVFRIGLGRDLVTSAKRPVLPGDGGGVGTITDDDVAASVYAGPDLTGVEGSGVAVHGTASAPATWTVDDPRCTVAEPAALDTTVTCTDDLVATLTLTAADGANPPVSDTASVTVENAAPSLRIIAPADRATVDVGQPVTLTTEVSDPGSDQVTCSVDWGDGTTSTGCAPSHAYAEAGDRTVAVTADDGDGGRVTASIELTVVQPRTDWPFDGFFAPVDNLPTVNVVKAGSAVPLRFSLHGYRGTDIFAAGYPASASHACGSTTQGDLLEETATPGASELSYDAATDRYQYVWKTAKSWSGQCRTLTVKLADGSVHTAEFRLK